MPPKLKPRAPFGHQWNENKLELRDSEARICRLAFQFFAETKSKGAVARELTRHGFTTRRGSKWSDVAVDRVLRCESVRGLFPLEPQHKSDPDYLECPRIVPEELWRQAQDILQNSSRGRGPDSAHPFTGILRCTCGAPLHMASSSPKYACAACGNRIPVSDIERVVLEEIFDFLKDRTGLLKEMMVANAELLDAQDTLAKQEREFQRIAGEIQKAERLCMENRISTDQFDRMNRGLLEQERVLKREIARAKSKAKRLEAKRSSPEPPSLDTASLKRKWPFLPAQAKRAIIQSLFDRIIVGPDEIEFIYSFSSGFSRTRAKPRQTVRQNQPRPPPRTLVTHSTFGFRSPDSYAPGPA